MTTAYIYEVGTNYQISYFGSVTDNSEYLHRLAGKVIDYLIEHVIPSGINDDWGISSDTDELPFKFWCGWGINGEDHKRNFIAYKEKQV